MRGKRVRPQRSMRAFDRVRLGTAECAGWAGYYRKQRVRVLVSAVSMVRVGFGTPSS